MSLNRLVCVCRGEGDEKFNHPPKKKKKKKKKYYDPGLGESTSTVTLTQQKEEKT